MAAKARTRDVLGIVLGLLLAVACLGSSGCVRPEVTPSSVATPPASSEPETPAVEQIGIRVSNEGTHTLEDVVVKFPGGVDTNGQDEAYGDLALGETSEYRVVKLAYSYAYVSAAVEGETLVLQPIDYVGEEPLTPGAYTYILRGAPRGPADDGGLELELRRD